LESAKRELQEETGYTCGGSAELLPVDWEAVPGMGSTPHRVVFLSNCEPSGRPTGDVGSEGIVESRAFTDAEIDDLIAKRAIRSLVTLAAIFLQRRRRMGAL
jgi:hypothetical protein